MIRFIFKNEKWYGYQFTNIEDDIKNINMLVKTGGAVILVNNKEELMDLINDEEVHNDNIEMVN